MSKIGEFSYPDIPLSEAIRICELVVKQYRGTITTSGLAEALGMSEKGGGFLHKMAALRDYRLVEGRGTLRVTPIGERIILPKSPAEAAGAACQAFISIPLFEELDLRLGDEVPDLDRFAILLGEVTRDRIQARRKAPSIRRYYADYLPFLREANATNALEEDETPPVPDRHIIPNRPEPIELKAGSIHLQLPRSAASIDIIRAALGVIEQQLREEEMEAARILAALRTNDGDGSS